MDAWEHATNSSDHLYRPRLSLTSKQDNNNTNNNDSIELSSEWIDEDEELSRSFSSCRRPRERPSESYADKRTRSVSRGRARGLFSAESRSRDLVSILSKGFRPPKADDATTGTDEDMTVSEDVHGSSLSSNSGESVSLADGSRRFLLQKVDSIRLAAANRRDAKRTALEESLMQQLADMQSRHDEAMREMEIKLQQREAAIQTLERALCLRNEAVEEVRDELDFTRAKLNDAERMIQRYVQETNQVVAARSARSASPPNGHITRRRSREIKHAPTAAQFLSDTVHNDARTRREFSNELSRNANHASNSRALLLQDDDDILLMNSREGRRVASSRSNTSSEWDTDDEHATSAKPQNTTRNGHHDHRGHHRHKSASRRHDLDKDRSEQGRSEARRQNNSSLLRHQLESLDHSDNYETQAPLNSDRRTMLGGSRGSSRRSLMSDKHFES